MTKKQKKEYSKVYFQNHREEIHQKGKMWYKNNLEKVRNSLLKNRYGITIIEYDRLYQVQQGKCAICKRHSTEFTKNLAVDHNHLTGKIRGLLCSNCNSGLGTYEKYKEKFIVYLKEHSNEYI